MTRISTTTDASRQTFGRVFKIVDKVALSVLYTIVCAGLPMVAVSLLAQTA